MKTDEEKQMLFIIKEYATLLIECVLKLESYENMLPTIVENNTNVEESNVNEQNIPDDYETDYCSTDCSND